MAGCGELRFRCLAQCLRLTNLPGPGGSPQRCEVTEPPAREPGRAPPTPWALLLGSDCRRPPAARALPPGAAPRHRCSLPALRFPGPSAATGRLWCPTRSPRRPGALSCAQHTPASCSQRRASAHPGVSQRCTSRPFAQAQAPGVEATGSASPRGTLQRMAAATQGVRPPCRAGQGGSCLHPPAGAASVGVTATHPEWSLPI